MRTMKKGLGLLLAITVALSTLGIPVSVTAADPLPEGYLFLEDFDDMTTIDRDSRFTEDYIDNDTLAILNGALAVTGKATKAVVMNLSEPVTSGQVTWSMKVTPGNNYFNFIATGTAGSWSNGYSKTSIGDTSKLNLGGVGSVQGVAGTEYTLNIVFDLDNDKSTAQWVDADGDVLLEGTNYDFTLDKLAAVAFQGGWTANCDVTYFDDISVREGEHLIADNILWKENFNTMTKETMGTLTAKAADVVFKTVVEGDTIRNNSIGIAKNSSSQGEITKNFAKVSEDCVKFTYSVYVEASMNTPVYVKNSNGTNFLLAQVYNGAVYHSTSDGNAANRVCTASGWVTIENIINLYTHSNKITVYDADGKVLGSGVDAELTTSGNDAFITDVAAFNVRTWAAIGAYTYLDDVKIEKFVSKPELTNNSVTMIDYKGGAVPDVTNPTPGITTIILDFGTNIKEDTLTNAVTLTQDSTEIPHTGAVSGSKYIMTVNGLTPEKAYKLTVANTVENNEAQAMDNTFTMNFNTTKGSTAASLISIKDGDEDAKLPNIITGDTLTVNVVYENTLAADMRITYIVAYYLESVLADIQVIKETATLTGAGTHSQTFNAKDMTGITGITVFMWGNTGSLKPLSEPYEISFETGFSNLVTTFKGDAETSRGFAWTAMPGRSDMVIRYAEYDAVLEENYTEVEANSTEYNGRLYYKADLSGLTEGTEYNYIIGDAVDDVWSPVYTFATEAKEQNGFSFIAVTDTQGGSQSTYDLYKDVLDAAVAKRPDAKFMLSLGDLVDMGYDEKQWDMYFDAAEEYCTSVPHMAIVGNHETRDDSSTPEYDAGLNFRLHFNNSTEAAVTVRQNIQDSDLSDIYAKGILENIEGSVYSFDYGDVHVAALNSGSDWGTSNSLKLLEAQSIWLEQDLKASTAKWKIVILHQGLYPARTDRYFGSRDILEDMLVECGVDLVLQGHDHMVARTYPMKDDSVVTKDTPDSVDEGEGIVYLIPGSSGDKRYSSSTVGTQPDYLKTLINTAGSEPTYSIIDVTDAKLSVNTYKLNGELADSFEIIGLN